MPAEIRVVNMFTKLDYLGDKDSAVVNTTSRAGQGWSSGLSPFLIGPCPLYGPFASKNMENGWQFAKLYQEYADEEGLPTDDYWEWAENGWNDEKAHRYPAGKGRIPLCSIWDGNQLGYIEARKRIYAPLYYHAVHGTAAWDHLVELYETKDMLILRDFDAYDHVMIRWSLTEVLNNPDRKMGHAFVLAMMLLADDALSECHIDCV